MSCHYRLTIVKLEDNPEFASTQIHTKYFGQGLPVPSQFNEVRQVEATLSEAEVDCIKQALLKVWK